jgi:prepilin-type processing-associated H-X9-DG protein
MEVVFTVAAIAALSGLTLLALSGVRASGRSARCLNNLRQMALGANSYALAHDYFPAAIRYERRDGVFRRVAWDWVTSAAGDVIEPGAIWRHAGLGAGEIHQCPEYEGPSNFSGDPFTGYNYNTSYLGGEAPFPATGWDRFRFGVPYSACNRSSTCAMFGDGGWAAGANKFMRAPENSERMPWSIIYGGGQAFRHHGGTNIAFIDGHVGRHADAREGVRATPELLRRFMAFPSNGFLSDDDRAYRPR